MEFSGAVAIARRLFLSLQHHEGNRGNRWLQGVSIARRLFLSLQQYQGHCLPRRLYWSVAIARRLFLSLQLCRRNLWGRWGCVAIARRLFLSLQPWSSSNHRPNSEIAVAIARRLFLSLQPCLLFDQSLQAVKRPQTVTSWERTNPSPLGCRQRVLCKIEMIAKSTCYSKNG